MIGTWKISWPDESNRRAKKCNAFLLFDYAFSTEVEISFCYLLVN